MIPNEFGLIRQKDKTLIGLPFNVPKDISDYYIEVLAPTWQDGFMWRSSNTIAPNDMSKACKINVSKFDYVILPISNKTDVYVRSGLSGESDESSFSKNVDVRPNGAQAYACFEVTETRTFAKVTIGLNDELPIIGLYRHRSDNVNPKGIIKDVNSVILQPVKEDELNGEADRIRNDLSGNAESPDFDINSGSGADERADS